MHKRLGTHSILHRDTIGPLLINHDGTQLVENPYSWSKVANVLYMESPSSVGFSYETDKRDGKGYTASDGTTAADNFAALQSFFELFPEYQKNEFYVSGEVSVCERAMPSMPTG